MKKFLPLALALAFITPVQANEIPGTRVAGQGAVCAEGQGKAVDFNATTKEETSYCIEIYKPTAPEVEAKTKEQVAQRLTNQNAQNAPTVVATEVVTAEPVAITEVLIKIEVNATTKVETITVLSEIEKEEISKQRAVWQSQQDAKESAKEQAQADKGTEYCVNWSAQGQSGTECVLEPIPATTEEVEDWWAIFVAAFPDWFQILSPTFWNW